MSTSRDERLKLNEFRSDERLKDLSEGSTRLAYLTFTGLCGGLGHLKIETRLIDEIFVSVMGEYVFLMLFIMNRENES